jgi:hypothetical protein
VAVKSKPQHIGILEAFAERLRQLAGGFNRRQVLAELSRD